MTLRELRKSPETCTLPTCKQRASLLLYNHLLTCNIQCKHTQSEFPSPGSVFPTKNSPFPRSRAQLHLISSPQNTTLNVKQQQKVLPKIDPPNCPHSVTHSLASDEYNIIIMYALRMCSRRNINSRVKDRERNLPCASHTT